MTNTELRELIERLGLYAEELIEPPDGDVGGARLRAAKIMREAAAALKARTHESQQIR